MPIKWTPGRQGTGYLKVCLLHSKWFDLHILKYPVGAHVPLHRDEVEGYKHHRLNITVRRAEDGGLFGRELNWRQIDYSNRRLHYFRPDVVPHCVTRVRAGIRYVLSIGWLTK